MNDTSSSKEAQILKAVKFVLTSIAKETATAPGMKHPLSDATLTDIRHCLTLISERERELLAERGDTSMSRPVTADQRKPATPNGEVVIPLHSIGKHKPSDDRD